MKKLRVFTRVDGELIRHTIDIYKKVIDKDKKSLVIGSIFIPLQHLGLSVVIPLIVSFFIQSLITHPDNFMVPMLLVGGMVVTGIVMLIAGRVGFVTIFNHQERMTTKLTEYALHKLLEHSHNFFANRKVGSLAGDVNTFARSYMSLLDALFFQASNIVVNIVASLIVVAFVAPLMLPVLVVLTMLILFDALRSYNARSVYRNQRKELMSKLFGSIADTLGNQTLVRMFSTSSHEIHSINEQRHGIERVAVKEIYILQRGAEMRIIILLGFQIVTLLACLWLFGNSLLSIAALIFIITYLGRISGSMFAINSVIRQVEQAFLDAAKITEILQEAPEVIDIPNAQQLSVAHGTIELKDVNFHYKDAASRPVFEHLNIAIPAGQSIGLVGRSGSGKSTLTHLLLRYMDIQKGAITVDDQDIATVTQSSLRSAISYVPQDPYLFHRTLRENIAYGKPDASKAEIIKAAKQAHAWEFIKDLPEKLDTVVGERGVKLSGGQRQRIAIARAILKDAPILILDEATSALDSESEKLIQAALEELMKNRTSIVIAHRLSTIAKLDRIIVLDKGTIVQDGTHASLHKEKGTYAELWNHQSGGFIDE